MAPSRSSTSGSAMNRRLRHSSHETQLRMLPKTDMPKPELESSLMKRILSALKKIGVLAWRNHVGAATIDGRYQRFGSKGSADIFAVVRGRFVGIEVKRPGLAPSKHQEIWRRTIMAHGGGYIVATSVDDAVRPLLSLSRGEP